MIGPFRLRQLPIDTGREAVAYLPRHSTVWRPHSLEAIAKIALRGDGAPIFGILNIVGNEVLLAPDEIGVDEQTFARLGLPEGAVIHIEDADPPSLEVVRAKIRGADIPKSAIDRAIRDIAARRYSRLEIGAFLVACAARMSVDEVLDLTTAMADAGSRLHWQHDMIVDIHSIGGVPGNRISMVVVPIVAAHGLIIPKTSSRAIHSPAGTADTMEALARVDLSLADLQTVVAAEGGCIVWGDGADLSPADDILISVERSLEIDAPSQLVASILSKKLAAGVTHLLVELPVGPSAKVKDEAGAIALRKLFEFVAARIGIVVDIVATDGSQPIGSGIGPALEARDVMRVLHGEPNAPEDLRSRALEMAARVLEFDPALRAGSGLARARELLESGAALRKMERILAAQGRPPTEAETGRFTHDVIADRPGAIASIDCTRITRLALWAGAPFEKGAGIDLIRKVGDHVSPGEPLYRIHAGSAADLRFACDGAAGDNGYCLSG